MVDNMSYLFNDKIRFNSEAVDAFGRLKVSQPFTLFDSQHRYQENDKWDTSTSTGGSITFRTNESAVDINVTTTSGSKVTRETKRVFAYQPGKSLLILSTFVFASKKTNLRQRIGYFGTQNGIYLEQNNNDVYLVLRTYVGGSVDDSTYRVAQSSWNGDRFNGTGPSGRTIDFTKANIMWMDVEWLGVGDVRVGFIVDGRPVIAHTFHNDNLRTTTYMTTASLPLRMEIENTGTTDSVSTAKQICNSVMSEAGYEGFSRRYNVTKDGSAGTTLTTAGTQYPMVGIMLNSSRLDSVVVPSNISAVLEEAASNKPDTVLYRILLNPTVTGGSWINHYNGNVDYNITATSVSGGTDVIGGYISSSGSLNVSNINDFNFQLGRTQAGVSDIFMVTFTPINAGAIVYCDLSWFEII
jgi:hypothetical protein